MKKVIILSFVLVNTVFAAFSQNEKFTAAMTKAINEMQSAKSEAEVTAVAAKFERIADAEKTQWLPYYYAALCKVRFAFEAKDKDKAADEIQGLVDKADALATNKSEILCIKAMVAWVRMMVDPQARYMQYGMEASKNLAEAKKLDATNPRPYVLEATSVFKMPEQFGGGCTNAKPIANKANEMLQAFKPESPIYPTWGKESLDEIFAACK